jgi:23S rRNA-/tRNA-specific pseudouridylate synthase
MVFVRNLKDELKGRSKILHTDKITGITTLLVGIYKGVRHQIRVHLAGIGYPVI